MLQAVPQPIPEEISIAGLDEDQNAASILDPLEKTKLPILEEAPLLSIVPSREQFHAHVNSEGSLGVSDSLGGTVSQSVASTMRTENLSSLLNELTATVSRARLNSSNGQDITFQFRDDVLDRTSVHINANTTQMEVAFSTSSEASNAMLNAHLATLQNHLTTLCPGQVVEIKTHFIAASTSSEFNNESEAQDDFSNLNQENRGDLKDHDDTL